MKSNKERARYILETSEKRLKEKRKKRKKIEKCLAGAFSLCVVLLISIHFYHHPELMEPFQLIENITDSSTSANEYTTDNQKPLNTDIPVITTPVQITSGSSITTNSVQSPDNPTITDKPEQSPDDPFTTTKAIQMPDTPPTTVKPMKPPNTLPATTKPVQPSHTLPVTTKPVQPSHTLPATTKPVQPSHTMPATTKPVQPPHTMPTTTKPVQPPHTTPATTKPIQTTDRPTVTTVNTFIDEVKFGYKDGNVGTGNQKPSSGQKIVMKCLSFCELNKTLKVDTAMADESLTSSDYDTAGEYEYKVYVCNPINFEDMEDEKFIVNGEFRGYTKEYSREDAALFDVHGAYNNYDHYHHELTELDFSNYDIGDSGCITFAFTVIYRDEFSPPSYMGSKQFMYFYVGEKGTAISNISIQAAMENYQAVTMSQT